MLSNHESPNIIAPVAHADDTRAKHLEVTPNSTANDLELMTSISSLISMNFITPVLVSRMVWNYLPNGLGLLLMKDMFNMLPNLSRRG